MVLHRVDKLQYRLRNCEIHSASFLKALTGYLSFLSGLSFYPKGMCAMTNYEAIKNMSVNEMAAVFYLFAKPMMDAFEMNKKEKDQMRESIMIFLNAEVKKK